MKKINDDSLKIFGHEINFISSITLQAVIEFIFVALILTAVGWLAHCEVNRMLNQTFEETLLRHVKTLAGSVESQFNQEFAEIRDGALMMRQGKLTPADLVEIAKIQGQGTTIGILRDDGVTLAGDPLPRYEHEQIAPVFSGHSILYYTKELGLLFAVPTTVDGRRCAYYETYDDEMLKDEFGVYFFDGSGIVTLGYKTGAWTELSYATKNLGLYYAQNEDANYQKVFRTEVIEELRTNDMAIARYDYQGKDYFTFGAKIWKGEFAIFGSVPYESVAIGAEYIHSAMFVVFGLLFLILVMIARYLIKSVENKQLQREKRMADQANRMKTDFLSNVSHEIRTPINAILGMDEMILRESKDVNILEYAENLRHAGNSLLGLVNDILDFSKIEAGKMEIIPVDYQLSSLLNDLVNMIHTRATKKGLKFIAKANHELPTLLHGDEIRIKQVVTNILTNAVKYTERGSVTLSVDFVKIDDSRASLRFSVQDTGIGIKAEDLPKLFSAFERIEEERNRTIEGTGLGMAITKKLLSLMNTKLDVESVYGEGSTFSFAVEQGVINWEPLGDFEEAFRHSLTQRKEYREKFTAPRAHILVIDDTQVNLVVVRGLLKQTKIRIETAESGYDCLKLVTKNHYDIIFLDHRMPGLDGIETLHEIQKLGDENLNADTPVIALTANAISGAREQYIAAGFSDYLSKPIMAPALEAMIMKYLPPDLVKPASSGEETAATPVEEPPIDLPDWLLKVDGIDFRSGIEHCGSADAYLSALTVFAESIVSNANEIEIYKIDANWKNYTTKVHALKSTARVIGANELSERAKRLEDAGNSGYIDEIEKDTAPLLELYRSYSQKLAPLVATESSDEAADDKPLIGEDELAEAIETLKEVASSFDYDSVMFVLDSLNDYKLPDDQIERFKAIKDAASKLDWEKINELINQ